MPHELPHTRAASAPAAVRAGRPSPSAGPRPDPSGPTPTALPGPAGRGSGVPGPRTPLSLSGGSPSVRGQRGAPQRSRRGGPRVPCSETALIPSERPQAPSNWARAPPQPLHPAPGAPGLGQVSKPPLPAQPSPAAPGGRRRRRERRREGGGERRRRRRRRKKRRKRKRKSKSALRQSPLRQWVLSGARCRLTAEGAEREEGGQQRGVRGRGGM